ncbi:elongation factor P [Patescibacteria group bacterium]|nr:elongation factor P [Patescibacteria group bacterium]MBU1867855.1 elongation factor P [Patescibacteria group bacterium]
MSIPVNDLHKDVLFKHNGGVCQVLEYKHKSIARGKADIKIKAKNLENGATIEIGFKSGQTVENVDSHRQNMEFVYLDERKQQLVLVDPQIKKRIFVPTRFISSEKKRFLAEGAGVQVLILDGEGKIIAVDIPITVELEVQETPPSEKGDTAIGGTKPATLTTGTVVQVPMFIKKGDVIKVNTERGEYMERVK